MLLWWHQIQHAFHINSEKKKKKKIFIASLNTAESAVTYFWLVNLHLCGLKSLVGDRLWHFAFFLSLLAVMHCNVKTINEETNSITDCALYHHLL